MCDTDSDHCRENMEGCVGGSTVPPEIAGHITRNSSFFSKRVTFRFRPKRISLTPPTPTSNYIPLRLQLFIMFFHELVQFTTEHLRVPRKKIRGTEVLNMALH